MRLISARLLAAQTLAMQPAAVCNRARQSRQAHEWHNLYACCEIILLQLQAHGLECLACPKFAAGLVLWVP